jgi:hypothetical protein
VGAFILHGGTRVEREPVCDRVEPGAAPRIGRRARAYTDPYHRVVRAKIVLMAADGLPNTEIAARLDGQPAPRWFIGGGNGFSIEACRAWKVTTAPGDHGSFPPGGRRGQTVGLRIAGHYRRTTVSLELC